MNGNIEAVAPPRLVEINKPANPWLAPVQVWRNVYDYRFLVGSFIQRDLRVRYRNSVLGYFWSLLEPLLLTATYYLLFVVIAGRPEPRYPLWVVIGVISYGFFKKCLTGSVTSLTSNASLIKQVYFPRELFAFTYTGSSLIVAVLSLFVAVPFLIYYGVTPSASVANLLLIPVGLSLLALLGLGVGLGMAVINAVHRDVEHFFQFLMRALFFTSPVMWTLAQLPDSRAAVLDKLLYNPLAVPLSMIRSGVQGEALTDRIQPDHILYAVAVCVGSFLVGAIFFKRFEAEVVKNV